MTRVEARCAAYQHGNLLPLRAEIFSDIRRFMTKSEASLAASDDTFHRVSAFLTPELLAQTIYRFAHYCYVRRWLFTATLLTRMNSMVHKINIPPQSCIGPGLHIPHPCGITFCGSAGSDCTLYSLATVGADVAYADGPVDQSPYLGDRVTIAAHEAILGPMTMGDDVKTGLFTFRMDFDVPSGVIVRGRVKKPSLHAKPGPLDAFQRPAPEQGA